jgi:hypothetical protein
VNDEMVTLTLSRREIDSLLWSVRCAADDGAGIGGRHMVKTLQYLSANATDPVEQQERMRQYLLPYLTGVYP